jgi:hypothetical protein
VLGEDGSDSEELIDSAEQSMLAAAAEGIGVHRAGSRSKPPVGGGPEAS